MYVPFCRHFEFRVIEMSSRSGQGKGASRMKMVELMRAQHAISGQLLETLHEEVAGGELPVDEGAISTHDKVWFCLGRVRGVSKL